MFHHDYLGRRPETLRCRREMRTIRSAPKRRPRYGELKTPRCGAPRLAIPITQCNAARCLQSTLESSESLKKIRRKWESAQEASRIA